MKSVTFVFLISTAFLEVACWTIDLPEARKYFFEKSDNNEGKHINITVKQDDLYFDNIVPDSPHNKEELDEHSETENHDAKASENDIFGGGYAKEYEYMSYMEKKVHGIVHNGSVYLEGLRRALEDYGELLVNCSRMNFTQSSSNGPWLSENERPNTGSSTSYPPHNPLSQRPSQLAGQRNQIFQQNTPEPIVASPPISSSNQILGNNDLNQPSSTTEPPRFAFRQLLNSSISREVCERATLASEHVKRLSQLALWATRELQDRAYNDQYNKAHHTDEEEEEEAELLLRLAFFLDRLAYYTGYEPEAREFIKAGADHPLTTTQPPPSVLGSVPDEVKMAMLGCLQLNSSDDAVVRCRYPLRYPQFMRRVFNVTDPPEIVEGLLNEEIRDAQDPSYRETFRNPVPPTRQKRHTLTDTRDMTFDSQIRDEGAEKESRSVKRDMSKVRENLTGDNNLTIKSEKQQVMQGLAKILEDTVVPVSLALQNTLKPISTWLQDIKLINLSNSFANLTANLQNLTDNLTSGIKNFTSLIDVTQLLTSNQNSTKESFISNLVNTDNDSREKAETSNLTAVNLKESLPPKSLVPTPRRRRSIDDHPLQHFFNYYVKHKTWTNSNTGTDLPSNFDVANHLTPVKTVKVYKRSIDNKKMPHLLPENPIQDISGYLKHSKGVSYNQNQTQKDKLEYYLTKLRNSDSKSSKLFLQKILKSHRSKRSIQFEKKKLPSRSENPRQDISYYEKNKLGTNYENNIEQAGQVRAGLEQVYQTGNILVVQRYGSNYNPLIPFPLAFGIARTTFGDN